MNFKSTKPRVLIVHDDCTPLGGANIYRRGLTEILEEAGYEIFLFTYKIEDAEKTLRCKCYTYNVQSMPLLRMIKYDRIRYKYFDWGCYINLLGWIKEIHPTIIHLQHNKLFTNSVLLACASEGIPVVQTVHDYQILCPTGKMVTAAGKPCNSSGICCYKEGCIQGYKANLQLIERRITQYLLKHIVNLFIAPSLALKERLVTYGLKARYIPNGVDIHRYQPQLFNRDEQIVLFVGALYDSKGVDILIEAFSQVLQAFPDAKLAIVGDGTKREKLHRLSDGLHISAHVRFYDAMPNEELIKFYGRAQVLVLSSRVIENCPLTILEAMASARLVIGPNIGGPSELIVDGETGFLFEYGNINNLVEKIICALQDPFKTEMMGQAGRRRVEQTFTINQHRDVLLELYEELINEK